MTKTRTIIRPGPGRIAVKMESQSDTTASGLWIPESSKNEAHIGIVVANSGPYSINDGPMREPDYAIGDRVLFGRYVGSDIKIERESYVILMEKDIMCTLEDEEVPDGPNESPAA